MKAYLFILLLAGIACYKQWWQNSNIPDLTTQNFFDVVGKDKWVFVKFYTTWCGYCRKMAPEFDRLFDLIGKSRSDILIRRLEGDSNEDITYAYDIHSFPKLVLYKPGSVNVYSVYQGYRTADEMFKFLNQYAISVEPVKQETLKIVAVEENKIVVEDKKETVVDKNVTVEDKPKVATNATQTAKKPKTNSTARTNSTISARKANETNIEEFKNNTMIEVPIIENTVLTNETLNEPIPKNEEIVEIQIQTKTEDVQLRQNTAEPTEEKKDEYTDKDLEEIKFLKDEVKFLSEKLGSMQTEIQTMKTLPQSSLKPFDFVFFGVVLMVILAVILTIKKIYNKLKVS